MTFTSTVILDSSNVSGIIASNVEKFISFTFTKLIVTTQQVINFLKVMNQSTKVNRFRFRFHFNLIRLIYYQMAKIEKKIEKDKKIKQNTKAK